MRELDALLNKRWVLKSEDKELYYKIRDSIGEIRKFATEKMGCPVIENSLLVKMEKIPAIPEEFMGITEFTSKEEYAFLCILLMFLEDKDAQEQFILSQLTEYIAGNMPGQSVDWTLYVNRRRLIKVLRYAVSQGLLRVTDGSDDVFMDGQDGEVLYESTGASRYFVRNFPRDIMEYEKPEDFEESEWALVDEERGLARRYRVYKRLLFSVGMYRGTEDKEDFEYLKYYGRRLAEDLEQNFDCRVHIHRGCAFLLAGDEGRIGAVFPENNAISDILLLCCAKIREKVKMGEWKIENDEKILVDRVDFEHMVKDVHKESSSGFIKSYREMPEGEFVREVMEELSFWTFIRVFKQQVIILPSAGKVSGTYPQDYTAEEKKEEKKK